MTAVATGHVASTAQDYTAPVSSSPSRHLLHFVLDLTSSWRFDQHRTLLCRAIILPIVEQFRLCHGEAVLVSFAVVTGSVALGLHSVSLRLFTADKESETGRDETCRSMLRDIERFLERELDGIVDFGAAGDSISGAFGVAAVVEAVASALALFDAIEGDTSGSGQGATLAGRQPRAPLAKHVVLLPTSVGTETPCVFRTCPVDRYARASVAELIGFLRSRGVSLSLVAAGLGDSTVVDQFIVFKCNERVATGLSIATQIQAELGPDWIVRLSAGLFPAGSGGETVVTEGSTSPRDENQTLVSRMMARLATMTPTERICALKTIMDPSSGAFTDAFRQQLMVALKTRPGDPLRLPEDSSSHSQPPTGPPNHISHVSPNNPGLLINTAGCLPGNTAISNANGNRRRSVPHLPSDRSGGACVFWTGAVRFLEKQQAFVFRAQFSMTESQQRMIPRVALDNWPPELSLTGLLDGRRESIQAGLNVGYPFRVTIAPVDVPVASYLMARMTQTPSDAAGAGGTVGTGGHLACFRISQDVLVMLRVAENGDTLERDNEVSLVGCLIDRRHPKTLPPPPPFPGSLTTTLSTGMDSLSLQLPSARPPRSDSWTAVPAEGVRAAPIRTAPRFHPHHHPHSQPQPLSSSSAHLLTDPRAILQKMRPPVGRTTAPVPLAPPANDPGEEEPLDASFVDAWLN